VFKFREMWPTGNR